MPLVKYQETKNCRAKGQFLMCCSHTSQEKFRRHGKKLPLTEFLVSCERYRSLRAMKSMESKGFAVLSGAVMNSCTLVFYCISPGSFCKMTLPATAEKASEGDFPGAVSTWYRARRSWASPNGAEHSTTPPGSATASFLPHSLDEHSCMEEVSDRTGALQPLPCCAAPHLAKGTSPRLLLPLWTELQTEAAKPNPSLQNYPA